MRYTDAAQIRGGDSAEGAAIGLLALVTGISEELWCAGWVSGIEYALWNVEGGTAYGQGTITARQAQLLKLLSAECGGWWRWDDGAVFVSLAEWEKIRSTAAIPGTERE